MVDTKKGLDTAASPIRDDTVARKQKEQDEAKRRETDARRRPVEAVPLNDAPLPDDIVDDPVTEGIVDPVPARQRERIAEDNDRRVAASNARAREDEDDRERQAEDEYEVLTEGAIIGEERFDDGSDAGTPLLPIGHKVMLTAEDALRHQKAGIGLRKAD
jgi:hypothetical protein